MSIVLFACMDANQEGEIIVLPIPCNPRGSGHNRRISQSAAHPGDSSPLAQYDSGWD